MTSAVTATNAANVTVAAQPTITSVGTLTSLSVSGNTAIGGAGSIFYGTGAQLYVNGTNYSRIDFSPNWADPIGGGQRSTGTRILFNGGTGLGRLDCGIGMSTNTLWTIVQDPNFNVAWYAGDGSFGATPVELMKITGSGNLTVKGSITAPTFVGTLTTAAQPNITSVGTLTSLTVASTVNATTFVGTLTTAAQPNITSLGTLNGVTSNAATAFIAGDAAISGVALQIPREGALRNTYNGANNNMYFDVSTGGTSQGIFQFRSSSAFTNVSTMSPTAFNVNTEAVVTAKTASFGRTAWNAAIDTELTIDDYRFRVSNQGGIFPQVISNTGGTKNSAWTVVAARSGSAIGQGGSTGTLVPNNSWTSLYTFAGMDSAGDTYVATLQDKNQGRIYRITFMRSDNGATTGYNIIAERLL
jgi:hypothetical protein